jgi:hypothetical protein
VPSKKFKQGYYTPKHPDKYVGDLTKIIYRSSWEYKMNEFLDNNPNVLRWGSEPFGIPYIHPFKKDKNGKPKIARYFPDYWIQYKNKQGEVVEEIIEIKPKKQTKQSRARNPQSKLYEDLTFAVNIQKWKYAQEFCDKKNIKFRILTELSIFR